MNRLRTALAAFLLLGAATLPVAAAPPAEAIAGGGFYHVSPDDGYDDPIRVACDWNNVWNTSRMIAEGQRSPCSDTDGMYVAPGTAVLCRAAWSGWNRYNAGWHKIYDGQTPECVVQIA